MDWFLALSAAEKTYFIIAAVASIFLVIQIIIMMMLVKRKIKLNLRKESITLMM